MKKSSKILGTRPMRGQYRSILCETLYPIQSLIRAQSC